MNGVVVKMIINVATAATARIEQEKSVGQAAHRFSAAQTKTPDKFAVTGNVMFAYVIEKASAPVYHAQQTFTGVKVVRVLFEMFRQAIYACSEQGNLHIGRTCISIPSTVVTYDREFCFRIKSHLQVCSMLNSSNHHLL